MASTTPPALAKVWPGWLAGHPGTPRTPRQGVKGKDTTWANQRAARPSPAAAKRAIDGEVLTRGERGVIVVGPRRWLRWRRWLVPSPVARTRSTHVHSGGGRT